MKRVNSIKGLAVAAAMAISAVAGAQQVWHPLKYPAGTGTSSNFYADYVGPRFQVTAPTAIAGDKAYTFASTWGGAMAALTDTVKFGPASDSDGCLSGGYPAGYFNGKIALVWRGSCYFSDKALAAQNAGAVACVIVNNVSGGPVGMAAGTSGPSVTIPVYMISLDDGMDITAQLRAGNTVVLNITPNWGNNLNNDLGFVPTGYDVSAYNALPLAQYNDSRHPIAYVEKEGAYIANYGRRTATHVKLRADLNFTASETTTPVFIHSDSVTMTTSFPVSDSIYALFTPKYSIPTLSATGKFDLKYTISSDSVDQFAGDNVVHYSFYATDSLYSKGRYDIANRKPYSTIYTGPSSATTDPYMWGVPYYVSVGGGNFSTAQFSVVNGGATTLPTGDQFLIYVFKWVDVAGSAATPDSFMEVSELQLVGAGLKTFGGSDSSFQTYTVNIGDSLGNTMAVHVDSNSWYVLMAECPQNYSLGCDGLISGYPRAFGLHKFDNVYEFYNPIWFGDRRNSVSSSTGTPTNMVSNPGTILYPWSFDGTGSLDIDSVAFDNQKGLIPSIPFTTSRFTTAVSNTKAAFATFELYPNPANDVINVKLGLDNTATTVSYTIINNMGQSIHKDIHHNVGSEVYSYNTSTLATGVYYLVVAADGKTSFKRFAVTH
ncbi:MAG: T9SS C-terminal target domain-containing protein [Chitinophagia bacterium]|nr:T9SS C-terminal target domain-containing protein [Chitinophagia bacterium]